MTQSHFTRFAPGTHSNGALANMTLLESNKRRGVKIFTSRTDDAGIAHLAAQLHSDYQPPYVFGRQGQVTDKPDLGGAETAKGHDWVNLGAQR